MTGMGKSKTIILILLVIAIALGGTGCMILNRINIPDKIIKYMNKKYDDTFYFSDRLGGTFDSDIRHFLLTSDKFPNTGIWASYNLKTGEVHDNYTNIKYEDQVNELIDEILNEVFPEQHYHFDKDLQTSRTCVNSERDISFEEFVSQSSAGLEISAYVDISDVAIDKNEITSKFEDAIVSRNACFLFCTVWFFENYDYELETSINARDYLILNNLYDYKFEARMDDNSGFSLSEWEILSNG